MAPGEDALHGARAPFGAGGLLVAELELDEPARHRVDAEALERLVAAGEAPPPAPERLGPVRAEVVERHEAKVADARRGVEEARHRREAGPREHVPAHEVVAALCPLVVLVGDDDALEATRRFIALIDILYESHTLLVTTAAAEPEKLYTGKRFRYEFKRTISRLEEMRSTAWLAGAHWAHAATLTPL